MPARADSLQRSVRRAIKALVLPAVYGLLRSDAVARRWPFRSPPTLLLSYPRSGSTWVGTVLATSPDAAYLHEPVTRPSALAHGQRHAMPDVEHDDRARALYETLADAAFQGKPPRDIAIAGNLRDFSLPARTGKRLVIKEVNPRATAFYCRRYAPRVLLLLRHPAAVALSFAQLGWLGSPDVQLHDGVTPWERFGHTYGVVMHEAIRQLNGYGNYELVAYEQLALAPEASFAALFESAGLRRPPDYDLVIRRFCYSRDQVLRRDAVERTSSSMVAKWHTLVSASQLEELRAGFLRGPLPFYREASAWEVGAVTP